MANEGTLKLNADSSYINLPAVLQKRGLKVDVASFPNHKFLLMIDKIPEESFHPGFVEGLGLTILNNSVELFEEFCSAPEGKTLPRSRRHKGIDVWMYFAASLGSQSCFEFGLMNGAQVDFNIAYFSIQGGNKAIIHQCFEKSPRDPDGSLNFLRTVKKNLDNCLHHYLLSNALDFRRIEIVDWLLENNCIPKEGIIAFEPTILEYRFLPIPVLSKFLYPVTSNIREMYCRDFPSGEERLLLFVAQVLRYSVDNGFPCAELCSRFRFKHRRDKFSETIHRLKVPDLVDRPGIWSPFEDVQYFL